MMLILWLLAAGAVLELALQVSPLWRARLLLAPAALLITAFASAGVVAWRPNVFSVLVGLAGLYRGFNDIRIVEARMHEAYLRHATRQTTLVLVALQAVTALVWAVWHRWYADSQTAWIALTSVQALLALVLLAATIRRLRRTEWPNTSRHYSDDDLPTLSVAIPARNETEDLQQCLETLVASDYPKLEILVLDDCSQTRRTPEIIRGFAHDGVRFFQGEPPQATWLAKNQAYDRLAAEASGDYILFCGVDVRFGRHTLHRIVATMLAKHKTMMSILPERAPQVRGRLALAQAMRYFWELAPPRRLFRRPPVISTCWVVAKDALRRAGGFEAVSRSIVPEAYFARRLAAADAYSFMRSSFRLELSSVKSAAAQRDTAVRMRYPQLHRRPENVYVFSLLELVFLVMPLVLAAGGTWFHIGAPATALAALAAVVLAATHIMVNKTTHIISLWLGPFALPLMAMYDIGLLHYSMWRYEFSTVEWKGRNICEPAMHAIPHLPVV